MKRIFTALFVVSFAFSSFSQDSLECLLLTGSIPYPDYLQPLIEHLEGFGFNVTVDLIGPASPIESYDFVIIGENIPSTNSDLVRYSTAPLPVLLMKMHCVRPNGLGWHTVKGDNTPDSVILIIEDHPILTGLPDDEIQYCSGLDQSTNENGCGYVTIPEVGGYLIIGENADEEPNHTTLAAIDEGTTLNGITLVNRAVILGYSSESFNRLAEDGIKLLENACYWLAERESPYYVSSISPHNSSDQALVYPSPSSGMVKMKLDQTVSSLIVKVSGIDGRVLFTKQYHNTSFEELDLSELHSGIYFIHLEGPDFSFTERLIINK